MKRSIWALVVAGCLAVLPTPAMADEAAVTETVDVTGAQFACEDATYTLSGEVLFVVHEGQSASGNENFTLTISPRSIEAVSDEGDTVKIVGAFWVGGTFNAKRGTFQFTVTDHFQIIEEGGGTIGDVQVTGHVTFVPPDKLVVKEFDFGTCSSPGE